MIRIAFPLLGRGLWTGGEVYLRNTLAVLRQHLRDEIEAVVLLTPAQNRTHGASFAKLVDEILVDERFAGWGRGASAVRGLVLGAEPWVRPWLVQHRIDVLFEHASYFGLRSGAGILPWFPDFQHRLLPDTFSRYEFWHRDVGFRLQIAGRKTLMLSSQSARDDFKKLYPGSRIDVRVVRFAAEIDPGRFLTGGDELRAKYGLPERFFYLPNQFWRHKNYEVVVDALEIIARRRPDFPPVILSGRTDDTHARGGYYPEILARIAARGVGEMIRHVGMVPYEDVLRLNGACHALINPSLFEGWSTPIEEAKALGTPTVLSNLAVHREQVPDGRFFDPRDPQDCARALMEAADVAPRAAVDPAILLAEQQRRVAAHAAALRDAIRAVAAQKTLR